MARSDIFISTKRTLNSEGANLQIVVNQVTKSVTLAETRDKIRAGTNGNFEDTGIGMTKLPLALGTHLEIVTL